MKLILLAILLSIIAMSCNERSPSDEIVKATKVENLTQNSIVHEVLSDEQLEKIAFIQKTFEEVYPISFEETVTNFKRDQNPDNEIAIWLGMCKAYEPFAQQKKGADNLKARKEAFKLILMRSMMTEEETINNAELEVLEDSEIQKILSNYSLEAKPVSVEK